MRKDQQLMLLGGVAGATVLATLAFLLVPRKQHESPATSAANVPPGSATAPSIMPRAGAMPVTLHSGAIRFTPGPAPQPPSVPALFRPMPGLVYAGGSPNFDEATGTYRQAPTGALPGVPSTGTPVVNSGQMRIMPYPTPEPIVKAVLHPIPAMPVSQPHPAPALGHLKPLPIQAMPVRFPIESGRPKLPVQRVGVPAFGARMNFAGGSSGFDERRIASI